MNYGSALLIGPPGAGKTTAAATAPTPVLFLDVDNKLHKMQNVKDKLTNGSIIQWAIDVPISSLTLTRLANEATKPQAKVTFERPLGYAKMCGMIDALVDNQCIIDYKGNKVKVNTVVLDSY